MSTRTVLYVEDEEFDAMFMRMAFERNGLEQALKVVTDGQQAIDYLAGTGCFQDREQHPLPSLVLLDLNLPLVSGFEALAWLRNQPMFEKLPVVIFSSSARPEDMSKATALGANAYISKPVSGLEFTRVVQDLQQRYLFLAGPAQAPSHNGGNGSNGGGNGAR